jgi:hypothetical protein
MLKKRVGDTRRKTDERRLPFDRRIQNVIVSPDRRSGPERRTMQGRRTERDRRIVGF